MEMLGLCEHSACCPPYAPSAHTAVGRVISPEGAYLLASMVGSVPGTCACLRAQSVQMFLLAQCHGGLNALTNAKASLNLLMSPDVLERIAQPSAYNT